MGEGITRRRGKRAVALSVLLALCAILAPATAARGEATHLIPNWPELLPPFPGTGSGTVPPGFDVCPSGASSCPNDVVLEMYERWRGLNVTCDHDAVFALTYLRTTEEFVRTIRADPTFFGDGPWVNHEDAVFGKLYFNAFDDSAAGSDVPAAWRIAFEAAESPNVTAVGDLLLGMNAHINRDLPYTLAAVGLVKPDGSSRKLDHDRVNQFLERVADPLQIELARRYDSLFQLTDADPSPVDEESVLQLVRGFRENAWRNAERLVSAGSDAERQLVSTLIETEAELGAQSILAMSTIPGYGPTRDAHCAANLEPSFRVTIRDGRLRGALRRGRLRVAANTDGPARYVLTARGKLSRGGPDVYLLKRLQVVVRSAGRRAYAIRLTDGGRRLLARDRPVDVTLRLTPARGPGVATTRHLRRG